MQLAAKELQQLFDTLLQTYGPQHWWPAQSPFEIAVGAILVQRTAWRNAELAIEALRQAQLLAPLELQKLKSGRLQRLIKPAGFAVAKAAYLKALSGFLVHNGGIDALRAWPTSKLRDTLLAVHGVGPETADALLLYLFERPVWVADAYAERIFSRLTGSCCNADEQRERLAGWYTQARVAQLQELHALLVAHGKERCRVRPRCQGCALRDGCVFVASASGSQRSR